MEFRKLYNFERIHIQHIEDSICDCDNKVEDDGSKCQNEFHDQEAYCEKYCKKKDILTNYISLPQYYHHSENYCAGSVQHSINGKQSIETRNVFQFINNLIYGIQDVNIGDSRDGFEIYYNVFLNGWILFSDNNTYGILRRLYDDLSEYGNYDYLKEDLAKRLHGDKNHLLCATCYCKSCLMFRIALAYNVKFDVDLLVLGDSALVTKEEFKGILDMIENDDFRWSNSNWLGDRNEGTTYFVKKRVHTVREFANKLIAINPLNEKYHIKLSKFDLRHVIFMTRFKSHVRIKYFDETYGIPISSKQSIIYADLIKDWNFFKIKIAQNRMLLNKMNEVDKVQIDNVLELMNKMKFKLLSNVKYKPFHPDQTDEEWKRIGELIKRQL